MPNRQFVACKFRIADTRTFTYHNDGDPVAEGDIVRVPNRSGDGWNKVFVVEVGEEAPPYETKPILGLHVEDAPPADPLFDAAVAALR